MFTCCFVLKKLEALLAEQLIVLVEEKKSTDVEMLFMDQDKRLITLISHSGTLS